MSGSVVPDESGDRRGFPLLAETVVSLVVAGTAGAIMVTVAGGIDEGLWPLLPAGFLAVAGGIPGHRGMGNSRMRAHAPERAHPGGADGMHHREEGGRTTPGKPEEGRRGGTPHIPGCIDHDCNLFHDLPEPGWYSNEEGERTHFNRSWYRFTGIEEAAGTPAGWEEQIMREDRERYQDVLHKAYERRESFETEYRLRHASGTYRWMSERASPRYDGAGRFAGFVGTAHDTTAQRDSDDALREALREKDSLLKEVHHRVKNNLQIISSLLSLQLQTVPDEGVRNALTESRNRIRSMALIHEQLYQGGSYATIDFGIYVRSLIDSIRRSYIGDREAVHMECRSTPVTLGLDTAIPLGLIINELVTNAAKYAFPAGAAGNVTVVLERADPSHLTLTVSDDGVGLPSFVDPHHPETVGLGLVQALIDQLDGSMHMVPGRGTTYAIAFREQSYAVR